MKWTRQVLSPYSPTFHPEANVSCSGSITLFQITND